MGNIPSAGDGVNSKTSSLVPAEAARPWVPALVVLYLQKQSCVTSYGEPQAD